MVEFNKFPRQENLLELGLQVFSLDADLQLYDHARTSLPFEIQNNVASLSKIKIGQNFDSNVYIDEIGSIVSEARPKNVVEYNGVRANLISRSENLDLNYESSIPFKKTKKKDRLPNKRNKKNSKKGIYPYIEGNSSTKEFMTNITPSDPNYESFPNLNLENVSNPLENNLTNLGIHNHDLLTSFHNVNLGPSISRLNDESKNDLPHVDRQDNDSFYSSDRVQPVFFPSTGGLTYSTYQAPSLSHGNSEIETPERNWRNIGVFEDNEVNLRLEHLRNNDIIQDNEIQNTDNELEFGKMIQISPALSVVNSLQLSI